MSPSRRLAVVVVVLAGALVACADAQDPGLVDERPGTVTTSNTLGQCPPGGPDGTTPVAGCLGPDGSVQHP